MALTAFPARVKRAARRGSGALSSPEEPSDEAILSRVAGGDRDAFGDLFTRYAPKVKSYLMRLGARAPVAEDLAQDVLISVWRRAASFDPAKGKPSTWVFVIARNAWIDRLRREKIELAYNTENPPSEVSEDEAPDAVAARADEAARVADALACLPDEQRQVVLMSFFEERPHSEIAERLALPLGTVKSRLRLALIKLRAAWERSP